MELKLALVFANIDTGDLNCNDFTYLYISRSYTWDECLYHSLKPMASINWITFDIVAWIMHHLLQLWKLWINFRDLSLSNICTCRLYRRFSRILCAIGKPWKISKCPDSIWFDLHGNKKQSLTIRMFHWKNEQGCNMQIREKGLFNLIGIRDNRVLHGFLILHLCCTHHKTKKLAFYEEKSKNTSLLKAKDEILWL